MWNTVKLEQDKRKLFGIPVFGGTFSARLRLRTVAHKGLDVLFPSRVPTNGVRMRCVTYCREWTGIFNTGRISTATLSSDEPGSLRVMCMETTVAP